MITTTGFVRADGRTHEDTPIHIWTAALRSGEYQQTTGQLAKGEGAARSYCCLGVACDLAVRAHIITGFSGLSGDLSPYPAVQNAFGLCAPDGDYYDDRYTSLAIRNDGGYGFAEIADIIDATPEGLFS